VIISVLFDIALSNEPKMNILCCS